MSAGPKSYAGRGGICADFSRTCEGCGNVIAEEGGRGELWYRCSAPGPRRGYTVSTAGRFLPYVPAWCPLMEPPEGGTKETVMNRKEELLERIKAVKALADRGERGEKENAQALLEKLMQKYGVTEADLELEQVETVFFPYHDELERRILIQVIFSVTGKPSFGCVGGGTGRKHKKRGADCTAAQRLEIEFNHKFFYEAAKKEFEVFLYAFFKKNGIFPPETVVPPRDIEDLAEEELQELHRAAIMAETMKRYTPRKAIEAGSRKERER